jgi:WD40 repeat protein
VRSLSGHGLSVTSVAISSDGKFLVSGSMDKLVKIWDAEAYAEVRWSVVLHCAKRGFRLLLGRRDGWLRDRVRLI